MRRCRRPERSASRSACAACAVRISISPKATWCRGASGSCRDTRSSAESMPAAWVRSGSPLATVWGSCGCATPAACAASACVATRTCASRRWFTGWDDDGGYAEWAMVDERYVYALPSGFDDEHAAPPLCAGIIPGRSDVRDCHTAGASASTGSVRLRTSLRRSHCSRAQRCTCSRVQPTCSGSPLSRRRLSSAGDVVRRASEPLGTLRGPLVPVGDLLRLARRARSPGSAGPRSRSAGIHLTDIPTLSYEREGVPGALGHLGDREHAARR